MSEANAVAETPAVETAPVQAQETATATKPTVKAKSKSTGNMLVDIATEVEGLSKQKALNRAESLVGDIDRSFIELGGVLKVIRENTWFDGFPSYGEFVSAKFGFEERKARYLEEIYTNLVDKQIPWEKVAGLGWTKLKDLAKVLTPENVDEWVAKAAPLSVSELQALLKSEKAKAEGESAATTSTTQTMKFKLQNDQIATVQNALAKAKGEVGTEYDNVALETICAGYLGGTIQVQAAQSPEDMVKTALGAIGWEKVFGVIGEVYPNLNVDVKES